MDKEHFKKLYEAIYSVTADMSRLIETDDINGIKSLLDVKDELIKKINEVKAQMILSKKEKEELASFVKTIKEIEVKNLEKMEKKQEVLKKKISETNKKYKTISSYNIKKEVNPALIDERE